MDSHCSIISNKKFRKKNLDVANKVSLIRNGIPCNTVIKNENVYQ